MPISAERLSNLTLVLLLNVSPVLAGDTPAEPLAYRAEHYRSPTPATLSGALVVKTDDARRYIDQGAIPVDTTPVNRTGYTDLTGRWNVVEPRFNIPNSLWLPNIGYGTLDDEMLNYFSDNLRNATVGDPNIGLVFYCYADCWMSWNAAKRAMELGYSRVIWYPEGTDGWRAAGLPLVEGTPLPLFEDN